MTESHFTTRIVGVRFRQLGRVFDYDAKDMKLASGDAVICEQEDKGLMLGYVSKPPISIPPETLKLKLRPVVRAANSEDLEIRNKYSQKEKDSLRYIRDLVQSRMLPMRAVATEIPLSGSKMIVFYNSEERTEFRDLVKELSDYFQMKIELRGLGARDETKYVGSVGPCGQETCCSRFIGKFHPVNIKMAKDQGLALNPTKVTGNCGRLKCCLAYEQPVYAEARKTLPKLGNCVKCAGGGCGIAVKLDILKQMVTVKFDDGTFETVPVSRILEEETLTKRESQDDLKEEENLIDLKE